MALMWVVDIAIVAVVLAMVTVIFSSILRVVMVHTGLCVVARVVIHSVIVARIVVVRIASDECRYENGCSSDKSSHFCLIVKCCLLLNESIIIISPI